MGYIERNLIAGERVIYKTGTHWWVWLPSLLITSLLLAIFQPAVPFIVELSRRFAADLPQIDSYIVFFGIVIILFSALQTLGGFIRWLTDEISVTNLRIVSKRGWLLRRVTEISLSKFEACEIAESLFGRLLGYKTLIITGTGGTAHRFEMVRRARALRDHILAQAAAAPAVPSPTIPRAPTGQSALEDVFVGATAPVEEVRRAAQFVKEGKRQEAAALVKQLVSQYPQDADVWYLVGVLHTDPFRQRDAYQKALEINPNHRLARAALQKLGL
jgi:membrane protein YdbS with pleckstrin-like domain